MAVARNNSEPQVKVANAQRAFFFFLLIAIVDLLPYAFIFFTEPTPILWLRDQSFFMCGWQFLLAIVIGAIGGELKQWHMTLTGTFFLVLLPAVVAYVDEWQNSFRRVAPNPLIMLIPLTLGYAVMLMPACGAHLVTAIRRNIRTAGNCEICDYNLTGNVSGKCPECGTPVNSEGVS